MFYSKARKQRIVFRYLRTTIQGNVFVMSGGGAVLIGDTGILGADLLLDRDLLDLSSLDLRFLSREEDLL